MGAILRVGIIGCGNIATRAHIPAWERCRDLARVVAVADPSEHARNHVGDLVGLSSADRHTDPGDLITRDDIDIIDVCTPQAFRRDVLVDAAAAGKHILCEKPLATTPADADRAVQAAAASGVVFAIMHNYLTTPEMIAVRDVLDSGALGDIRTATVNFLGVVHEPGAAGDWRHDPGLSGGGVLIDMLHGVYVLEALLGQPLERVSAHVSASDGARVEDQAMCRFETAHRVGLVNVAWGAGSGGMTVEGTKGRLEVRYENGGTAPWAELEHVRVTSADGAVTTVSGPSVERRVGDGEFPSMRFGTNAIVRDVAEAIRDGRAPIATENGPLDTLADRSWWHITLGYGHPESWWREFCYRLRLNDYDGWLSIEHEDIMIGRLEGVERSVQLLRAVAPIDPPDYHPQEVETQ